MEENKNRGKEFWSGLWQEGMTKWDVGYAVPVITEYADTLTDKSLKILIPGAGSGYEAEYLYKKGFRNFYVLDIAPEPLQKLKNRVPDFPDDKLLNEDFFQHKGSYDLIFEYTFFVALHPAMRGRYAEKIHELLKPDGRLVGALFNDPMKGLDGPPYGGTKDEYLKYFEPYFKIEKYEEAYNSIKPREGREMFINFVKRN